MNFEQLARMTDGELRPASEAMPSFAGVSTDSRTIATGQLFFAIRGKNHDGHRFLDQALAGGAAGLVVDEAFFATTIPEATLVVVENTHTAMLRLAEKYLDTLKVTRLGITGSNGKTTTKEYTYRLLNTVIDRVYRSPGNYNNLFGIPLAIFEMPEDTETAVLEMGISVPGEMDRLASVVKPDLMLITNIGPTHLEYLGTVEKVAHEKLQAMKHARPGARLVINADDPVLMGVVDELGLQAATYAVNADADFQPDRVEYDTNGVTVVSIAGHRFRLPLFGQYQVSNLMAAYAAVRTLGYSFDGIDTEEIDLTTTAMRGEIVKRGGITFISDCYNANPVSVRAGLNSLASLASRVSDGRLVVILGDMLELGDEAGEYHREIGSDVAELKPDMLIGVGPLSERILSAAGEAGMKKTDLHHFESGTECARVITGKLKPGDIVYLKGSRGIGLEVILAQFADEKGTD